MHVLSLSYQTGYAFFISTLMCSKVLTPGQNLNKIAEGMWAYFFLMVILPGTTLKTFSKSDGERKVKKQLWLLVVLWELFLSREKQSMQLEDVSGQTLAYKKGSLHLWPRKGT